MDERIIAVLRGVREGLQILYEPIDALTRLANYKKGYPPLYIRQKVGNLNDFEGSSGEYMAYLKLLCGLKPGMSVLDVGCGCGVMCIKVNENPTLPEYIYPGQYVGMDVDKELIEWCTKHLTRRNCRFYWLASAEDFRFKATRGRYDVVLCKSLFTHLFKHEVAAYLKEIRRLLKPGGKCLATFFLLNDMEPKGRYTFENWEGAFSLERCSNPRLAVAYEEKWVRSKLTELLFDYDVHYGSWRGGNKGLSFQDIIVLRR